ncbi:hypothetical protein DV515_00016289 [Chloebia gouldiae]|uniref:Uncharacterized protein n=1 Tax=Chloebia gouldiae TaxID=44316 RepID=A0A3L8RT38_CHLGU|nr:hypothetical protein DV515_00016289 [Chloebia gouldiae]
MAWVGRDLKDHLISPPCHEQGRLPVGGCTGLLVWASSVPKELAAHFPLCKHHGSANLSRCVFREVLSLEFLYLRVISGSHQQRGPRVCSLCCRKQVGDSSCQQPLTQIWWPWGWCFTGAPQAGPAVSVAPVLSWLFPPSCRVVTNSPSRLLLLQFEDVVWDYSLPADREELKKDKRAPVQSSSELGTSPPDLARDQRALVFCSVKGGSQGSAGAASGRLRLDFRERLFPRGYGHGPEAAGAPGALDSVARDAQVGLVGSGQGQGLHSVILVASSQLSCVGKPLNPKCVALFLPTGDEAEQGPPSPAPEEAEATLGCELPQRHPSCPMTPDKFLLTIGTLQSFCKPAAASRSPSLLSAKARAAQQRRPGEVPGSKTPLQHKEEQAAQLQRARLHSRSLTVTKTSTPFETKVLRLRLKKSLHSPAVKSSVPAPCVVRPKPCGSPGERKTPRGHGKDTPGPKDGDRLIDLWRVSSELMQPTPGTAAEMRNEAPRRRKASCPYTSRRDSGLRLLRAEQELSASGTAGRAHTASRKSQKESLAEETTTWHLASS